MRALLAHPRLPILCAAIALVLSIPSTFGGLQADDWWHRIVLHQRDLVSPPEMPPPLLFFRAFPGHPQFVAWAIDRGIGAWWTEPTLLLSFFRPITAATHVVDYALWPDSPWMMHAHSALWLALSCFLAAKIHRRILGGGWVGGLAALLFAVDPTHGLDVGWIAQRNTLVAAAFGFCALLLHVHARRDRSRVAAVLSPIALGAALLSGEAGLGILGFLLAFAATLDQGSFVARVRSIAPHLLVVAAWAGAYRRLGFGAHGSAMYLDPAGSPLRFLSAVASRGPAGVAAELGGPPTDLWAFLSSSTIAGMVVVAIVVLAIVVFASRAIERRAEWRFFLLGMAIAMVPVCATTPGSRLLFVVGFGGMGILALLAEALVEKKMRDAVSRVFTYWAVGGHLVLGPPLFVFASLQLAIIQRAADRFVDDVVRSAPVARLVVVNPPDCTFVGLLRIVALVRGLPTPERMLGLAPGTREVDLERIDDRTLLVHAVGGFIQNEVDGLDRDRRDPFPVGTRIELSDVSIEIVSTTSDGRADSARFRFAVPLEDPSLRFVRWEGAHFVPFALPAVGASIALPATALSL